MTATSCNSSLFFKNLNIVYALILFYQFTDCITTLYLINYGFELNPVMRFLIEKNTLLYVVVKISSAFVLVYLISRIYLRNTKLGDFTALVVLILSFLPTSFNVMGVIILAQGG